MGDVPRVPESELEYRFVRSSGPGGQHVNKSSTKVQLRWNVRKSGALPDAVKSRFFKLYANRINDEGELVMESDESRSQHANKETVARKLHDMVRKAATPPKPRKRTKPSRAAIARRRREREHQSAKKSSRKPPDLSGS
jgi:ribosome-associated protein